MHVPSPGRSTTIWRSSSSPMNMWSIPLRGDHRGTVARTLPGAMAVPSRNGWAISPPSADVPTSSRPWARNTANIADTSVGVVEVGQQVPPPQQIERFGGAAGADRLARDVPETRPRSPLDVRALSRQPQDLLGDGVELHLLRSAVDGDDAREQVLLAPHGDARRACTPTARSGSPARTQSCTACSAAHSSSLVNAALGRAGRPAACAITPAWPVAVTAARSSNASPSARVVATVGRARRISRSCWYRKQCRNQAKVPRSWLRMCIATAQPPSSSPTMRSAGRRAPRRTRPRRARRCRWPARSADTSTPGSVRSTMNAVRPRWRDSGVPGSGEHQAPPRVPRPARPDLAAGDHESITVGHARWFAGWPDRSPASGSENPWPTARGPRGTRAALRRRTAVGPWATSVGARISRCSNSAMPGTPWRASASHIAARCTIVPPSPPTSAGQP